jgi:hypothetical protein
MKIAVDFDGTIVDHRFPDIGAPNPGAFFWLQEFQKAGAELILWTMRCDEGKYGKTLTAAVDHCRENGVEFIGANENPGQESWTFSPKAYAVIYIDDAAFGCPMRENPRMGGRPMADWAIIGPAVLKRIQEDS